MCPDSQCRPILSFQSCHDPSVSCAVGIDLLPPPRGIRRRPRTVFGAPVPEATIDEHGNAFPHEDDISVAPCGWYRSSMNSVSKATPVEFSPESDLSRSVLLFRRLHSASHDLRGRSRNLVPDHSIDSNGGLFRESYTARILSSTSSYESASCGEGLRARGGAFATSKNTSSPRASPSSP
jgi:hypothetical protein